MNIHMPIELSDERINRIAELVVKGMPEGLKGFMKYWGWQQFAKALLQDCAGHYAVQKPLTDDQITLIIGECAARHEHTDYEFARAIEAAHGIGGSDE
jgi:hypothetical protein